MKTLAPPPDGGVLFADHDAVLSTNTGIVALLVDSALLVVASLMPRSAAGGERSA